MRRNLTAIHGLGFSSVLLLAVGCPDSPYATGVQQDDPVSARDASVSLRTPVPKDAGSDAGFDGGGGQPDAGFDAGFDAGGGQPDAGGKLIRVPLTSVATGFLFSCGLSAQGAAFCWGEETGGKLGNGVTSGNVQATPVPVIDSSLSFSEFFVSLTLGSGHVCALTNENNAYCWGADGKGQLGDGDDEGRPEPTPVPVDTAALAGDQFESLEAGLFHTCGVSLRGDAYCWGNEVFGELGNGGENGATPAPSLVDRSSLLASERWQSVTAGMFHTCGLTDLGNVYCWGHNGFEQLGNRERGQRRTPSPVDTRLLGEGEVFQSISAGDYHTCGVTNFGNGVCWGLAQNGAVGNGLGGTVRVPTPIDRTNLLPEERVTRITGGHAHSCLTTDKKRSFCFGADLDGRLGDGDVGKGHKIAELVSTETLEPGEFFVSLDAGGGHTCGVTNRDQSWCWGRDVEGQLGEDRDGDNLDEPLPVRVAPGEVFVPVVPLI